MKLFLMSQAVFGASEVMFIYGGLGYTKVRSPAQRMLP